MELTKKVLSVLQHYNHDKYWKMRECVQNDKCNIIKRLFYIFRIKRMDAFSNASTGIRIGEGSAYFESRPRLPHGLYGIIIAPGTKIGRNVRICQQVTIGNDFIDINNVPEIGDDVEIYPGAKIVGKVKVGRGAKIGANVVVFEDVPENAVVVVQRPRVIENT